MSQTDRQVISPPVGNLANQLDAHSVNQSQIQPVSHLALGSVGQSLNQSVTESVSKSVHQLILSKGHLLSQSINHTRHQSTIWP